MLRQPTECANFLPRSAQIYSLTYERSPRHKGKPANMELIPAPLLRDPCCLLAGRRDSPLFRRGGRDARTEAALAPQPDRLRFPGDATGRYRQAGTLRRSILVAGVRVGMVH